MRENITFKKIRDGIKNYAMPLIFASFIASCVEKQEVPIDTLVASPEINKAFSAFSSREGGEVSFSLDTDNNGVQDGVCSFRKDGVFISVKGNVDKTLIEARNINAGKSFAQGSREKDIDDKPLENSINVEFKKVVLNGREFLILSDYFRQNPQLDNNGKVVLGLFGFGARVEGDKIYVRGIINQDYIKDANKLGKLGSKQYLTYNP